MTDRLLKIAKALIASKYKVGDLVKFRRKRRVYKITKINQWGNYDMEATTGGPSGSRPSNIKEADIVGVNEKSDDLDNDGKTAFQAAEALKEEGRGDVVVGIGSSSDLLGEIVSITKKGSIKVQTFNGGEWRDQEHFTPTKKDKGKLVQLTPTLYNGEWAWWKQSWHIKEPYKGGKLTQLLD